MLSLAYPPVKLTAAVVRGLGPAVGLRQRTIIHPALAATGHGLEQAVRAGAGDAEARRREAAEPCANHRQASAVRRSTRRPQPAPPRGASARLAPRARPLLDWAC